MNTSMSFKDFLFPNQPRFIHRTLIFLLLHLGGIGFFLKYLSCSNVHGGNAGDGGLRPLCLFLGVFDHIYVIRDNHCVTVVGEHLSGQVDHVNHVETSTM